MISNKIVQILGILGLVLILLGATLYVINSPNRALTFGALFSGGVLFIIFVGFNIELIRAFSKRRSSRYGANMLAVILLFTCILVVIQALSVRHTRRFDLTRNKRFSLASQTSNLLKNLEKDITVYAFYKKGASDKRRAEDLLTQYAYKSRRLRYEFIDPDQKPRLAKEMGITSYGTTVVTSGDRKELIRDLTEEKLTNAILKVTRDEVKSVYFVQGHGEKDPLNKERDGCSIVKEAIEKENYLVKTITLLEEESVPKDCHILVIAGPRIDYFESEIKKMEEYLYRGKNAVVMIEPQSTLPNLESILAGYSVVLDNDIIIDPFSRIFGGDYTIPVVTQYENHPITREFKIATFFPTARSLRISDEERGEISVQYLAKTGKSAWGEMDLEAYKNGRASRDASDVPAPVPIALIASREIPDTSSKNGSEKIESKIVVFGDSDFADNSSFRISGNADLFMNTINFLAEEKDLISIRPKQALGDRLFLTASQGKLVFLLCIVILPLAVITFGTTVFMKKKQRG